LLLGLMAKLLFIGIDLGGTAIKFGLITSEGEIITTAERPTPDGRKAILGAFADIVASLEKKAKEHGYRVGGIGVGSPGLIDPEQGKVIGRSPNLRGWEGANIRKGLEQEFGLSVAVDNDANVMALAEHRLGAGKGYHSGLYVTVGTGIGSGVVLDDRLWRGANFAGAELGHTIIAKDGISCRCGKDGCLEVYANAAAIERYYGKPIPPDVGLKYIFERAKRFGDRAALAAIDKAAEYLAAGIGSAMELLNPEIVVIGGGVAQNRSFLPAVRSKMPQYCSRTLLRHLRLRHANLGNEAGFIGAALLAAGNG
jgi:glucokinase